MIPHPLLTRVLSALSWVLSRCESFVVPGLLVVFSILTLVVQDRG